MTFEEVIVDLKALIGKRIESVRPGAPVVLRSIDETGGSLILEDKSGNTKSRPLKELQRIWQAMNQSPAVHVEAVLQGSGTSRNQPETIMANLPYVEWAKIGGIKHIAFVGSATHEAGTLKQMGAMQVAEIQKKLAAPQADRHVAMIFVTNDLSRTCERLQDVYGVASSSDHPGVYKFVPNHGHAVLVIAPRMELPAGVYPVVYSERSIGGGRHFGIEDATYFKGNVCGNPVLFARPPKR